MHKSVLKTFEFLKSSTQFIKIVAVFCILMLLMYWIENLAGYNWSWLGFITPLLDSFINIGEIVSKGSIKLFAATFEYKYFIALVLFLTIYAIAHFMYMGLTMLEELYLEGRRIAKKIKEDKFNADLEHAHTTEQKRIKRFSVYIEPVIKQTLNQKLIKIDFDEETRKMNKYLIEKTGIAPKKFESGFLYAFTPFDDVDTTLKAFESLMCNDGLLDYIICVQVIDSGKEIDRLKHLIKLRFVNKITAWSDTVYRYTFNKNCKYETSQLGIFQFDGYAYEAHQFVKNFL